MSLELKTECKYSLLVATSMGVRITPVNGQPVHSSHLFEMQATSAETNVASIASFLGMPVKVLTLGVIATSLILLTADMAPVVHVFKMTELVKLAGP
jgi:hypothetical protein